ncbi:MAG: hypothetical protein VX841_04915 [Pseudomonadota bacterium]|jgi:hypothetical protein|nr:hypothetical protein [Pseudomonadota bacterium]
MNENKGLFASICGFFKSLFSSSPAAESKPAAPADGLTGVERYIRNKAQGGSNLTGVEKYIRNKTTNGKPLTGVEQYVRSQSQAKPMTGVERYIQSKG